MPPCMQGFGEHSLKLVSQFFPVHPGRHSHLYSLSVSAMQTPSFLHGLCSQSRTPSCDSQKFPVKPGLHAQLKSPFESSLHVPPLRQGLLIHGGPDEFHTKKIYFRIHRVVPAASFIYIAIECDMKSSVFPYNPSTCCQINNETTRKKGKRDEILAT